MVSTRVIVDARVAGLGYSPLNCFDSWRSRQHLSSNITSSYTCSHVSALGPGT
jgi:hypothetical protein